MWVKPVECVDSSGFLRVWSMEYRPCQRISTYGLGDKQYLGLGIQTSLLASLQSFFFGNFRPDGWHSETELDRSGSKNCSSKFLL
jgi:hypothetical protein